jgi:lysine-N-methylase
LSVEFHEPQDVVFTCSECGDCCRSLDVAVGPAERRALEGLDWTGRVERLVSGPATVPVRDQSGIGCRLPRHDDGACTYLGDDGRCLIHRHFGAEAKPLACRLYPFSFHQFGQGYAVDCSFSCRALSRGEGKPLKNYRSEWSELVDAGAASPQLRYRLASKTKLSLEMAATFQTFLKRFLGDRSLSIPQRIRRCLQFTTLATSGDPEGPSAAVLRDAIAKGLLEKEAEGWASDEMDRTQEAIFFQWLFLALNPPPANMDRLPKPDKDRAARQRVLAANSYRQDDGRPWVDNNELEISFATVLAVDSTWLDAEAASELLERFLLAKVSGQRFLLAGQDALPFTEAVPKFFLCYPMVAWTAKALAASRGEEAVEPADLIQAIRLVDRSLGQIATSQFPKKHARACDFVMLETDFVLAAATTVRKS